MVTNVLKNKKNIQSISYSVKKRSNFTPDNLFLKNTNRRRLYNVII